MKTKYIVQRADNSKSPHDGEKITITAADYQDLTRQLHGKGWANWNVLGGEPDASAPLSESERSDLAIKYKSFIENNNCEPGGVVVIRDGKALGWMDKLRDPHSWEPGCMAVDGDENYWVAMGGSVLVGAERWQKVAGDE